MVKKIRKTCILMAMSLPFIFLSGCWDVKDINHRIMPVVLGITSEEENYKVILQVTEPVGDSLETEIIIGKGKTLNQVIDNISADMESSLDLLHVKVIIIDHRLAEEGLEDLISSFMRSREISSKSLITTTKVNLLELFNSMDYDSTPIKTMDFFEKNAGWNPHIALTRIWHIYRSIHSLTQDTVIPIISPGDTTRIKQEGSLVIKKGIASGEITSDETLLYNALMENSAYGMIEVLDVASIMILGNSVFYTNEFTNGQANLTANLDLTVTVLETKGDTTKTEIQQQLQSLLQEKFKKMNSKLQSSGADALGTGRFFRNKLKYEELKNWRTAYFPNLNFTLNITIDIQNEGNLKTITN